MALVYVGEPESPEPLLVALQAWRANTRFAADPRNPYVYAHPLFGVEKLAAWIDRLSGAAEGHPPEEPAYTAAPVNSYVRNGFRF